MFSGKKSGCFLHNHLKGPYFLFIVSPERFKNLRVGAAAIARLDINVREYSTTQWLNKKVTKSNVAGDSDFPENTL